MATAGGVGGGQDFRALLLKASMNTIGKSEQDIEKLIKDGTSGAGAASGASGASGTAGASGSGESKALDQSSTMMLQYKMGNYSNLVSMFTNIEKMSKDALAGTLRNVS